MSKKVLFISNHAGFSKFNAPYMLSLHRLGCIIHNASPGIETGYYDMHFDVPITRSPISFGNIKALIHLVKISKKESYDLIHCHTPVGGVLGRVLKLFNRNTKVIYTAHGFHFYKGGNPIMWLIYFPIEFILSFLTDAVVTINDEDYKISQRLLFSKSVHKINGVGVDLDRFKPNPYVYRDKRAELKVHPSDTLLIYVAQFIKRKDHVFIVKAISRLKVSPIFSSLKVIFVGTGPLIEELKSLVADLGIADKFIFTGYVKDVQSYYQCSDILLSSSKQEGFGLNLVEGLATGLPYLVSKVRGHVDIHALSSSNYLYKVGDETDFVKKLELIIEQNERQNPNVHIASAQHFNVQHSLNDMLPIYNQYL